MSKIRIDAKTCIYQSTVWFGILFVILSAVFFGLSVVQVDLRWAGILFISLAVIDLLVFVVLRYKIGKSGGDTDMCAFFKCSTTEGKMNCCDACLRTCFCLGYGETRNPAAQSIRQTAVARTEGRASARSQRGNGSTRTNGTVRSISGDLSQRRDELRSRLRGLERHINMLFRDYTLVENRMNKLRNSESSDRRYLVTRERVPEKLITVQDSMHREYRKLCRWFQGNDTCTLADVEQAKERLRNIKEHLKSIQRRVERIERTIDPTDNRQPDRSIRRSNSRANRDNEINSLTENRHSSVSLTIPDTHYLNSRRSSTPEVATLEVPSAGYGRRSSSPDVLSPLPPPYQEEDPLPTITEHYTRASLQRESSIRSQATSGDSSPAVSHRPGMSRMDSFVSAASVGGVSVGGVSLSEGEAPTLPVIVPSATTGSGALVLHLPRNVVASSLGLDIPRLGEAPPSYEEASSSQV